MKKIILTILLFIFVFTAQCFANDRYVWIASDDFMTFTFDSQTIKFSKKYDGSIDYSIIEVWLKNDYSEDGKNRVKDKNREIKDIDEFSHMLSKYKYNIQTHQAMFLSEFLYAENGKVLSSLKVTYPQWEDVIPGSYGETIEFIIGLYSNNKTNRYYMEQRSK